MGPDDPILPSPSPVASLCWEANVVYTGTESVLGSKVATRLDVTPGGGIFPPNLAPNETYNGWINVNMAANPWNYHPAIPLLNITLPNVPAQWPFDEIVQVGMPYIGFAFKQLDAGNPATAYGSIAPHSYMRDWDIRNAAGGTITIDDLQTAGPVLIPSVLSWFGIDCDGPIPGQGTQCDVSGDRNPIVPIDNR